MRQAHASVSKLATLAVLAGASFVFALGFFAGPALAADSNGGESAMEIIERQVADWEAGRVYIEPPADPLESASAPLETLEADPASLETPEVANAPMTTQFACLPSCTLNDGRFLSIAGSDLQTLAGDEILLRLVVPGDEVSFQIGVYDGDSGGTWDLPGGTSSGVPLEYNLFADPDGDGIGGTLIGTWLGNTMPDLAWFDINVTNSVDALTPAGNYQYLLQARSTNFLALNNWSNFKVRTTGNISTSVTVSPVAFGFSTPLFSGREGVILYPNGPSDPATTTYDGTWSFFVDAFTSTENLTFWDGDFDRGAVGDTVGVTLDTDDPNTPGGTFVPPWAVGTAARPEGVAFVLACTSEQSPTGCPADDRTSALFLRTPSVGYTLTSPLGEVFVNDNPSGNREWEKFSVSTAPFDPTVMDYNTASLPAGIYRVDATGLDLANLNAWRFFNAVLGVCEDGTPCREIIRSFLIGDTVFLDSNGNGVQDAGETGVEGVLLNLVDSLGNLVATTTTDIDGLYEFNVDAATLTVEVDSSNFDPGGVLEGYGSTTGGESITDTVTNDNILTYDFGYAADGSIGNYVWYDENGDGVDNEPGTAGIGGVTVNLTEAGPDGVFDTADDVTFPAETTDSTGFYDFTNLVAGLYRVDVDESTLPANLDLTTANEPLEVTLGAGEDYDDADFGYVGDGAGTGSLGDLVWFDANSNGVFDSGETGIGGVTVNLDGDIDGDGNSEILLTTVTDANGNYSFGNLPAGTYTVTVDSSTLPTGLTTPTYDLDGTGTPDTATVTLGEGENNPNVDYGYAGINSVGDTVWNDVDGDGVRSFFGEPGISGVTLNLKDSGGNVIATTVTDGFGLYLFEGLPYGTFTVEVDPSTLPAGFVQTYDLDGLGTPHAATFTLSNAGGDANPQPVDKRDVDFGYQESAGAIGDTVWQDLDGDGTQNGSEPGIGGVTVNLRDSGGTIIDTTVTDANGNYVFENLGPDTYTVEVDASTLPAGVSPTYDLDGIGTPNVATVTLGDGEINNDVDFGYQGSSSLGDRVWLDRNGDGAQDADEGGLVGVTVNLLDGGGNVIATTTTGANGIYGFADLAAGTYTVEVDDSTLPAGVDPSFDLDGTGTAHTATVVLGGGEDRTDVDFGYVGVNSVGDVVWDDVNGDGVRDFFGEPGIPGVTLTIVDGAGNFIGTEVTDSFGLYVFEGLPFGTFTVTVDPSTLPAGYTQTYDLDGLATPHQATFDLVNTGGDSNPQPVDRRDVDFGYQAPNGEIGDRVWRDDNGDGVQDAGEPGISGVTVTLRDSGGNVVGTTVTDGNGNYSFTGLPADDYTVEVDGGTLPAGLAPTYDYDGIGTPNVAAVTLGDGEVNNDVDFGYQGTGAIGDRVWQDDDGDGVQDAGEPGIAGVTVTLRDSGGNVIDTAVTDGNGNYGFTNLPAGDYTVEVDGGTLPAGLSPTYDYDGIGTANVAAVTLAGGEVNNDVDFGYQGTGAIGDRVWRDDNGDGVQDAGEPGIAGVTVTLRDSGGNVVDTAVTDGNGNYGFTNLPAGDYTVEVDGGTLPAGLSPTYDYDGIGTANVAAVTLAGGEVNNDVDFGYQGTGAIGDRVWRDDNGDGVQDAGEPGIAGVTVTLRDSGGNVIGTAVTDGNGNYGFTNLPAGDYTVEVDDSTLPTGLAPTYDYDGIGTPNVAAVTLGNGEVNNDVDFGYQGTGAIGDRVWRDDNGDGVQDAGEPGISGATVTLRDSGGNVIGTAVTDGNGNYAFTNLPAGDYTVDVDPASLPAGVVPTYDYDGIGTANTAAVTLAGGEVNNDVDFGYQNNGAIGDRVWNDDDGDGVQDAGEPGLPGVTVTLRDSGGNVIGTMVTDGNGNYSFTDLPPGDYTVEVDPSTVPAGYTPSFDYDGTGTPNTAAVTLAAGETNNDVDFGYEPPPPPASIGDRVWLDLNVDGVQDAGEPGIDGVTVELLDAGGSVIDSQITAGDGNYLFVNVAAGTYTVRVDTTTLPAGLAQTYDADGLGTPHQSTVTVAAGEANLDQDFGYADESDCVELLNGATDLLSVYSVITVEDLSTSSDVDGLTFVGGSLVSTNSATFAQNIGSLPSGTVTLAVVGDIVAGNPLNIQTGSVAVGGSTNGRILNFNGGGSLINDPSLSAAQIASDLLNGSDQLATATANNSVTIPSGQPGPLNFNVSTVDGTGLAVFNVSGSDVFDNNFVQQIQINPGSASTVLINVSGTSINWTNGNKVGSYLTSTLGRSRVIWNFYEATTVNLNARNFMGALLAPRADVTAAANIDGSIAARSLTTTSEVHQPVFDGTLVGVCDPQTGAIGDLVWRDDDGDGVQDGGEPGISNVTVTLYDGGGNAIASTLTDANGAYAFTGLASGDYTVEIDPATLPSGASPTYDLDGVVTPNSAALTLGIGEVNNAVDFGYEIPGAVSGRVWNDSNLDGDEDVGEAGYPNVTVELVDGGGNVVATTTTDGNGDYSFTGVAPGDYTINVISGDLPAGVTPTYDPDGIGTPHTTSVTVVAGQTTTDQDFGYGVPANGAIGDRVWNDVDGDGVQDGGEAGINDVTVELLDGGGNVIATQVTTGDGNYNFTGLAAGTYTVRVDASTLPASYVQSYDLDGLTTPNQATVSIAAGETNDTVDFGYGACGPCEGKVTRLTMQYLGSTAAQVTIVARRGPGNDTVFSGLLMPGEVFEIVGPSTGNPGFAGTLGTEIRISVDGASHTVIHTSCSQPIGPGTVSGDFLILGGASKNGGLLCPDGDGGGDGSPYCPTPAPADQYGSNGGHALWLPGISTQLVFNSDGGSYVENPDGTATLTGTVVDASDPDRRFVVDVTFTGRTSTPPAGSPKKELSSGAYVENGGPVDTSTWHYYTAYTGTLTGDGSWSGAVINFTRTGPAYQVGEGASGKNVNFGASGWFNWTVISQPDSGGHFPTTGVGDVNVDLAEGECPDVCLEVDFDTLPTGTIVDDEFAALGVTVSTINSGGKPAMVFDTANPTGGDFDLGTPNQGFGGPGVGSGGAPGQPGENTLPLGKVLIVSEDGDSSDPDDRAAGGTIVFTFDQAVYVDSVYILDIDEGAAGAVKLFDASGSQIGQVNMQDLGDNSVQTLAIDRGGVSQMKVWFPGSGSVSGFTFCPGGDPGPGGGSCTPGYVRDDFDQVAFNGNDGSVDWTGDWIENDAASPGPSSGRVWMQNGFLFLNDAPNTNTEPSIARQVDLTGASSATLRFAFDTSHQVDADDAIDVEISNDGGATWTVVETITGITGETNQTRTIDISAYASPQTQVRFRVANLYGGNGEFFCLQWVEISWTCPNDPNTLGSIGGTVWNDANGNGVQEDPTSGLGGVTVKLRQNGSTLETTMTDGNGYYVFTDLAAGDYQVKVESSSLPSGIEVPTYDLDGTGSANRANLTLGSGEHRDDADFGYQQQSSNPCHYCEHESGYLSGSGDKDWLPDGNYYYSSSGTHEAWLTGDNGDFDLYLYKWNGHRWNVVAASYADGTSNEHVSYNGGSGYYIWLAKSYSGSGSYDFYLDRP